MKITKFLLSLLTVFTLTSCLGDDNNDQYYNAMLTECINYVENSASGEAYAITGSQYTMSINITQNTMDLTILGIQLTPGGASLSTKIEGIQCRYDSEGNLVANVSSHQGNGVTISDLTFKMRQRYLSPYEYIPVFDIHYVVNGVYYVRSFQNSICYFGSTRVLIKGTATTTATDRTYYFVTFDKTTITEGTNLTAKLYIYAAKFADKMPEMDMMIFNIPATLGPDGFTLAADNLKVYTGTVSNPIEQPDYGVTNFKATANIASGMNMTFTAANRFDLSATLGYDFTEGVKDMLGQ